jgi:hypothetical protein
MLAFVLAEQQAAQDRLVDIWHRPLAEKLEKGWTQGFIRMERGPEPATPWRVRRLGRKLLPNLEIQTFFGWAYRQ